MPDKRYQVFLSSTFLDLQHERSLAVSAIMRMGNIPIGMEIFPASETAQWGIIENAIKESDYYMLLVGGRFGSVLDHRSYTEAEYELALASGIPVIPLLLKDHEAVFRGRAEESEDKLVRLNEFRAKLSQSHNCQYWSSDAELGLLIYQGLLEMVSTRPGTGWIRGSSVSQEDLLTDLNRMRTELEGLRSENIALKQQVRPRIEGLADFDEKFSLRFKYTIYNNGYPTDNTGQSTLTWGEIFCAVAPNLLRPTDPVLIKTSLESFLRENRGVTRPPNVYSADVATVKVQLAALGLIRIETAQAVKGGLAEFASLTDVGRQKMMEMMAIKTVK